MTNRLRKGMWVVDTVGRIAILVNFLDFANSEVHYVNEGGETTTIAQIPNSNLQQATFMDIPAPRRPSIDVARAKGY